ncbi:MAG: patatin-like phospholipase family protein [Pseudomonadota bacterium]
MGEPKAPMNVATETLRRLLSELGPRRFLSKAAETLTPTEASVNLALQGGGPLGAFTWGVLDAILELDTRPIAKVSGASAGSLNAAVLATGLVRGGRKEAREALGAFWSDVSGVAATAQALLTPQTISERLTGFRLPIASRNRGGDALRDIIAKHVDIGALQSGTAPRIAIAATHIPTGRARIFSNADVSQEALLASACLPQVQSPVEIDGDPYWDGGLTSNPPITPLVSSPHPVILVRLLSSGIDSIPTKTNEIERQLQQFLFARPLDNELEALGDEAANIQEIALHDWLPGRSMEGLPTPRVVKTLFEAGRNAGAVFLDEEAARGEAMTA